MNFRPIYLDASALVKLIVPETETAALFERLGHAPDRLSTEVARVEVHRALWREGASRAVRVRADAVLGSVTWLRVDEPILTRAASFKDPLLRALDAIHLASALSLGDDPDAFLTYDARLARAARKQRLPVQHPGVDWLI